jgi:hypothetical protein
MVPPHVPFFWLSIHIIAEWAVDSHLRLESFWMMHRFLSQNVISLAQNCVVCQFAFLVLSVFSHLQEKIECNETHHPQLPVAFTFSMTWIWFTTLMGTARLPVPVGPHGNSLLGVFQWPANIVLQSNMLDLVFHPIQKLLQWHVM